MSREATRRRSPDDSHLSVQLAAEGFNNPNHAAQRYWWIRAPSTSLRSTGIRVFPRTCGVLLPAGAAKLNPRCGRSAMEGAT
jgi:hypothetical protein